LHIYQVDSRHGPYLISQRITKALFKENYVSKPTGYTLLSIETILPSPNWHSICLIGYSMMQNNWLFPEVTRHGRQDLKYSTLFQSPSRLLSPRGKRGEQEAVDVNMQVLRTIDLQLAWLAQHSWRADLQNCKAGQSALLLNQKNS
jgi:hypothetical protein